MDGIVHSHEVEASGGAMGIRMPAEEQDGDVVVPVEEDKFLQRTGEARGKEKNTRSIRTTNTTSHTTEAVYHNNQIHKNILLNIPSLYYRR